MENFFTNLQAPAGIEVTESYGEVGHIPNALVTSLTATLEGKDTPNPHDVAEAIAKLVGQTADAEDPQHDVCRANGHAAKNWGQVLWTDHGRSEPNRVRPLRRVTQAHVPDDAAPRADSLARRMIQRVRGLLRLRGGAHQRGKHASTLRDVAVTRICCC
jgi:hypothetical protein